MSQQNVFTLNYITENMQNIREKLGDKFQVQSSFEAFHIFLIWKQGGTSTNIHPQSLDI